jgi:hypothetical protein
MSAGFLETKMSGKGFAKESQPAWTRIGGMGWGGFLFMTPPSCDFSSIFYWKMHTFRQVVL